MDHVSFLDRDHGFGWYWQDEVQRWHSRWAISRSDDGGRTWTETPESGGGYGTDGLPSDLYAADLERLWSPGMASFVGYSSDGGLTWGDQRAEASGYSGGSWFDRTGRAFTGSSGGLLWYRATEVTAYRAARPPQIDGNLADWAGVPAYLLNAERAYRVPWTHARAARRQRHPPGRLGRGQPLLRRARLRRCRQGRQRRQTLAG